MAMMKVLVPVDGSDNANRAVAHVLALYRSDAQLDIHLLNVQIPIDSGHARLFVSPEELEDYHRDEGLAALAPARHILDEAHVPYTHHVAVGHVADTITRYAKEHGFDKIAMGSHGRTALLQMVLGSVAHEVLKRSTIPVTLVKPAAEG